MKVQDSVGVAPLSQVTRRGFLRTTLIGGPIAALAGPFSPFASGVPPSGEAVEKKTVIERVGTPRQMVIFWLTGGPSQYETFDPKPDAPEGIRGPFGHIQTKQPGVIISENFPRTAKIMNQVALHRDIGFKDVGKHSIHNPATAAVWSGNSEVVGNPVNAYSMPTGESPLVLWANSAKENQGGLGHTVLHYGGDPPRGSFNPFGGVFPHTGTVVHSQDLISIDDPFASSVVASDFRGTFPSPIPRPITMDPGRKARRETLQKTLSSLGKQIDGESTEAWDLLYNRASAISGNRLYDAFDITKEPDSARATYGYTHFGAAALTARRLIDAGTQCVTLNFGYFDQHGDLNGNILDMKERKVYNRRLADGGKKIYLTDTGRRTIGLADELDLAMSAAIPELIKRDVMVAVLGEFGRAPKVDNKSMGPGRGHWPQQMCVVVAGPGITPGVYGESDPKGSGYPVGGVREASHLGESLLWLTGHRTHTYIGDFKTKETKPGFDLSGN